MQGLQTIGLHTLLILIVLASEAVTLVLSRLAFPSIPKSMHLPLYHHTFNLIQKHLAFLSTQKGLRTIITVCGSSGSHYQQSLLDCNAVYVAMCVILEVMRQLA